MLVDLTSGAAGYLASEIARNKLVAMVFASSPPRAAMAGSYEPIFGTKPFTVGVPADPEPIVLHVTTASMAFNGPIEGKTAGLSIPEDVV